MPWSITSVDDGAIEHADTDYDNSHPWDSLFNGPSQGLRLPDTRTRGLMDQAEFLAKAPSDFIRDNMTHAPVVNWGPERPEPTIEGILSGESLQPQQATWGDYTGTPAGPEASIRNHIAIGS